MVRFCPECGTPNNNSEEQIRTDEAYPDVFFKDLIMYCNNCNFTINSVLTKRIPNNK